MTGFCFLTWTCNTFNTTLTAVCLERPLPSDHRVYVLCLMEDSWRATMKPSLEAWELCLRISPHSHVDLWKAPETASLPEPSSVSVLTAEMAVWHWQLFSFKHNIINPQGKKGRGRHLPPKYTLYNRSPPNYIPAMPRRQKPHSVLKSQPPALHYWPPAFHSGSCIRTFFSTVVRVLSMKERKRQEN